MLPVETLFHYGSSTTLFSIVRNKAIWLSGKWHLNDYHEGEVFNRILREYDLMQGYNKAEAVIKQLDQHDFFVSCMTTDGDMLSQWRGYANGGAGVAIGFDVEALLGVITGSSEALLYKVDYADNYAGLSNQRKVLMQAILNGSANPSSDFLQAAIKERWSLKGKGFKEESEYRLILNPANPGAPIQFKHGTKAELKYRATDTDLRSYYELSFATDYMSKLVKSVVLGPKNQSNPATVKNFLIENGFANVDVLRSSTTFR